MLRWRNLQRLWLNHKQWIEGNVDGSEVTLAGSLGPGLSPNELAKLSKDPTITANALDFSNLKLAGGTGDLGSENLRKQITSLYDQSKVKIGVDDIVRRHSQLCTGFVTVVLARSYN